MIVSTLLAMAMGFSPQDAAPSALDRSLAAQAQSYAFARPNPGIHFSPGAGARYAMAQGCIPHIATGRPAGEFMDTAASGRRSDGPGRYTVTTAVILREDSPGSCTITVTKGDPEGLRADMLAVMAENGAQLVPRQDTGPGSTDSNGSFRQELHCVTLDGTPMYLLMSTSSARNRPRMMASLGRDAAGDCLRRRAP